ncbi:purine-cytosine permease family protein [Saccharopolyspora elongata]|uniref:Cytosine permease n=1 Tax=Saccharopolyspora elongata TaxID=2530387 RepID=A0A4R4XY52_9PSEU|nr:cytosine permease [Saccharopolyspora elongata]TDD36781.1 cytosine permease [Saccharopolyspora elongata]
MSEQSTGRQEPAAGIESATIQPIPLDQRHGTNRDMFTIWFGTNIMILSIVTGALATTVFGQPAWSAALAIVIGNLLGAVFMALHSAQGPRLGVPQMVQTKGQFGSWGSVLIVLIVVCMYLGFFISILVFGGASLASVIPHLGQRGGIVLIAVASLAATIWGYGVIHAYARIMTYVSGAVLLLAFVWAFVVHPIPATFFHTSGASLAGFMSVVSVSAVWQLAYAPYVSDYSRYMPARTGAKPAFWMSYWGASLGSILPMFLGAGIGLLLPDLDPVVALTKATAGISVLVVAVFSVGVAATNAMNLYCGTLCTITIVQTFAPRFTARSRERALIATGLVVVALGVALTAGDGFVATYNNFLTLLLGSLVPWTAVNLVDFYLVRHGEYAVEDFFRRDGGRYGLVNWPAVICYLIGVAVQLPFMVIGTAYTGPIARLLGNTDISFIAGLLIVSPLYYVTVTALARRKASAGEAAVSGAERAAAT